MSSKRHYRTCWISDLHLGSDSSCAEVIYSFLKNNKFDKIYLNGDIVDIWRLNKAGFLSKKKAQSHINVLQRLLKMSKKGTEIIYVLGNHDEFLENFVDADATEFGNLLICSEAEHTTANGTKLVVMHGHQFDLITRCSPWLAKLGDQGYHFMIWLNKVNRWARRKLNLKYWSLSKYIKVKVKKAVDFVNRFEDNVVKYVEDKDCDGIVVGHIHEPAIKQIDGKFYLNSGCWTDIANCSALVETEEGEIELIQWTEDGNEQNYGSTAEVRRGTREAILLPSDFLIGSGSP